jgi:hypothetical protein
VSETLRKEGVDGEAAIVEAFRKQGIKGQHLDMLSPELLRTELEFGALGHRLSFLQVYLFWQSLIMIITKIRLTGVSCRLVISCSQRHQAGQRKGKMQP